MRGASTCSGDELASIALPTTWRSYRVVRCARPIGHVESCGTVACRVAERLKRTPRNGRSRNSVVVVIPSRSSTRIPGGLRLRITHSAVWDFEKKYRIRSCHRVDGVSRDNVDALTGNFVPRSRLRCCITSCGRRGSTGGIRVPEFGVLPAGHTGDTYCFQVCAHCVQFATKRYCRRPPRSAPP